MSFYMRDSKDSGSHKQRVMADDDFLLHLVPSPPLFCDHPLHYAGVAQKVVVPEGISELHGLEVDCKPVQDQDRCD